MRPVQASIHVAHLLSNYQRLCQQAGDKQVMAVVKANAYGHGLTSVAQALYQAGCTSFAVSDAEEGRVLREVIGGKADIVLFTGIFDQEDALLCKKHALTPVLSEFQQLHLLLDVGFQAAVWLKVDTGMHRIGVADIADFVTQLKKSNIPLAGIMSHLACADEPTHPLNQQQIHAFLDIQENIDTPALSLLNSAGMVAFPDVGNSDISHHIVRPGLALYGIEPIPEQALGLQPVLQLSARIIQVRPIKQGESVSYGATWSADKASSIAVVAMGYADGLPRLLSNRGEVQHVSGRLPIVGRVCMDYCLLAVDAQKVKLGDEVIFFGFAAGAPLANDVAAQCQSIAYELLTGISARVPRVNID
ncbi:MAG: alanine racemase [Mariprofundaceae bacterium]|nr:alanine racemase [Mariprofundaceae bacterium]